MLSRQGANIDTATTGGRQLFCDFATLAEFENGTRSSTMAPAKRDTKVGDLCKELGATRQTLYRLVDPQGRASCRRHEAAQTQGPGRQLTKEQETKKSP